jgi:hypothetical protein
MIRAAYFMAMFREPGDNGKFDPPPEMGVGKWREASELLFPQLGDGRLFATFHNSIVQDQRHYVDCFAGQKTDTEKRRAKLGNFVHLSRSEMWDELRQCIDAPRPPLGSKTSSGGPAITLPHGAVRANDARTPRRELASVSDLIDMDMSGDGKEGYVYILTNSATKADYLKIGMTTRTSEERADEISRGTGVVCPFHVAYEEHVSDCEAVERVPHRMLSDHRIQTNREFFFLPLKEAIKIVQQVAIASRQDTSDPPLT